MKTHKNSEKIPLMALTMNKFFSDRVYEVAGAGLIEVLRQLNYVAIANTKETGEILPENLSTLLEILELERIDENEESLRSLGFETRGNQNTDPNRSTTKE